MPLVLLAGLALFVLLAAVGRHPPRAGGARRLARAVLAALVAAGAVVAALRGGWLVSLALAGLAAWLGSRDKAAAPGPAAGAGISMSAEEARSILGIGPAADRAEIVAAYRRLMRSTHPDHGGSSGLAAQVNAARDRLLKRP